MSTSCTAGFVGEAGCEKMLWAAVQRLTREQLGDAVAAMCTALQEQARFPTVAAITSVTTAKQHHELICGRCGVLRWRARRLHHARPNDQRQAGTALPAKKGNDPALVRRSMTLPC